MHEGLNLYTKFFLFSVCPLSSLQTYPTSGLKFLISRKIYIEEFEITTPSLSLSLNCATSLLLANSSSPSSSVLLLFFYEEEEEEEAASATSAAEEALRRTLPLLPTMLTTLSMLRMTSLIRSMSEITPTTRHLPHIFLKRNFLFRFTSKCLDRERGVVRPPVHLVPALPGQGLVLPAVAEVGQEDVALVVAEVAHLERKEEAPFFSFKWLFFPSVKPRPNK